MAKIKFSDNRMSMILISEVIRKDDSDKFMPDENGEYDLRIILNGQELDAKEFMDNLSTRYVSSVREQAAAILQQEYDDVMNQIHSIQKTLENHDRLFEGRVWPYLSQDAKQPGREPESAIPENKTGQGKDADYGKFRMVGDCEQGGILCPKCGHLNNMYTFNGTCTKCGYTKKQPELMHPSSVEQ